MCLVLPIRSRVNVRASLAVLGLSSIAIAVAACGDANGATNRNAKSKTTTDGGGQTDAGAASDASAQTSCHTDAGRRLACDPSITAGNDRSCPATFAEAQAMTGQQFG